MGESRTLNSAWNLRIATMVLWWIAATGSAWLLWGFNAAAAVYGFVVISAVLGAMLSDAEGNA